MTSTLQTLLKNLTNGKKIVGDWLKEKPLNVEFMDDRISELMTYHPNNKVLDPEYFIIRLSAYNQRTLFFRNKDADDEDSVSYVCCIQQLFGKYNRADDEKCAVKKAFRPYDDFRKEFYNKNTHEDKGICSNSECGKECGRLTDRKIHVDHCDIPFVRILEDYIRINKIDLSSICIYWEGMNPKLCDKELEKDWLAYHNSIVKYRILCETCNMSFGDKSMSS
jgi:hypothetical protein